MAGGATDGITKTEEWVDSIELVVAPTTPPPPPPPPTEGSQNTTRPTAQSTEFAPSLTLRIKDLAFSLADQPGPNVSSRQTSSRKTFFHPRSNRSSTEVQRKPNLTIDQMRTCFCLAGVRLPGLGIAGQIFATLVNLLQLLVLIVQLSNLIKLSRSSGFENSLQSTFEFVIFNMQQWLSIGFIQWFAYSDFVRARSPGNGSGCTGTTLSRRLKRWLEKGAPGWSSWFVVVTSFPLFGFYVKDMPALLLSAGFADSVFLGVLLPMQRYPTIVAVLTCYLIAAPHIAELRVVIDSSLEDLVMGLKGSMPPPRGPPPPTPDHHHHPHQASRLQGRLLEVAGQQAAAARQVSSPSCSGVNTSDEEEEEEEEEHDVEHAGGVGGGIGIGIGIGGGGGESGGKGGEEHHTASSIRWSVIDSLAFVKNRLKSLDRDIQADTKPASRYIVPACLLQIISLLLHVWIVIDIYEKTYDDDDGIVGSSHGTSTGALLAYFGGSTVFDIAQLLFLLMPALYTNVVADGLVLSVLDAYCCAPTERGGANAAGFAMWLQKAELGWSLASFRPSLRVLKIFLTSAAFVVVTALTRVINFNT